MSRRGGVLSVGCRPSRLVMVALTLLLVLTGSAQQVLDSYARELSSRNVRLSIELSNNRQYLTSYSYDANGNRTAAGADSYSYDWNNLLSSATVSGATVIYTYTGDGLRTGRTVAGSTTNFLWDRETGLPEIVDDGTSITVQSPIGALSQVDGTSGAPTYPLHDGLGTARVQTDAGGTVVGAADYDAFGNAIAVSGSQTHEGWAGESRDPDTGLTHLRARDYDPLTGRFTTADSESPNGALTQGYNAYHYTGNNPTTRTDPSGHNWLETIPAALQVLGEVVVLLVETLRLVMRSDVLPGWVKQFLGAVITFGLLMLMQTIVVILVVVALEVSGAGKFMVGRALVLSRLHTIGKMGQLAARCMGNQLCRTMSRWLVQNPDCVIEAGSLAVSYGISGSPNVLLPEGAAAASLDAGFLAKECLDRNPSGRNGFLPGAHSSKDPPKRGGSGPVLRGRAGEQRVANRAKERGWEVTEQMSINYTRADGSTSYVRVDMVLRAPNSNSNILVEVKSGGGRLNPHQNEGFEQIYLSGGSGKGPRARTADVAEVRPGTVICVVSGDDLSQIDSLLRDKGC